MAAGNKPTMNTEQKVREIIAEELGWEESEVTLNANLEMDLNADSLDVAELVMAIEEEFDIEISDEDAENVKTVQDAVNLAERLIAKN